MSKTVSVSEAREQLSAFIRWAKENRDDVIIQNRGRSEAVIISYQDYELLQQARGQEQRQAALSMLQELAQTVRTRNEELDDDEAERLSDELTREAVRSLADKGKVKFQQ